MEFGLHSQQCDRLLGKTTTWWGNHERGIAKTRRFYLDAFMERAEPHRQSRIRASVGSESAIAEYLKNERQRIGYESRKLDSLFGKEEGWWYRLERTAVVLLESELESIDRTLSMIPDRQKYPTPGSIATARAKSSLTQKEAGLIVNQTKEWWSCREIGHARMPLEVFRVFCKKTCVDVPEELAFFRSTRRMRNDRTGSAT